METIDYTKRSDMVAALVEARKQGIAVEVVGNGRTLRFPEGTGSLSQEGDEDETSLVGVVQPEEEEEQTVEEVEPEEQAAEEQAAEEDAEVEDLIGETPTRSTGGKRNRKSRA